MKEPIGKPITIAEYWHMIRTAVVKYRELSKEERKNHGVFVVKTSGKTKGDN